MHRTVFEKVGQAWSEEEIDYLRNNYSKVETKELCKKLNRTHNAIRSRASKLNLKRPSLLWTKEEDEYLEKNCKEKSIKEMSDFLGRTANAIEARMRLHGLIKPTRVKWDDKKVEFLTDNYNKMSLEEIAETIGCGKEAVYMQLYGLGIKKDMHYDQLNYDVIENNRKNRTFRSSDSQSDKSLGLIDAYKGLAVGIVRVSIDDLKKDIKALKRMVDRGLQKDKVGEAVKKVLVSESALFNNNFQMYLEADPKRIVLLCWEECKTDRNRYLKDNLYLIEDQLGKEFIY